MDQRIPPNITHKDYDQWDQRINDFPVVTQFYYINPSIYGTNKNNLKPFSQSGQVLSFLYMPFLEDKDLVLDEIPYDEGHYGSVSEDGTTLPVGDVKVYRITGNARIPDKDIGTFKAYPNHPRSEKKDWRNEGKIFQYPYNYISITDYINAPLKIIPHLLQNPYDLKIPVRVNQSISMSGGYVIYVPHYKGDGWGAGEGLMSSTPLDLPTSSRQYSQFVANSKSQWLTANQIAERNENIGFIKGGIQTGAGLLQGLLGFKGVNNAILGAGTRSSSLMGARKNIMGQSDMISGGIGDFFSGAGEFINVGLQRRARIDQSQAKINDLLNAPRNASLSSSDILLSIARGKKKSLIINRYVITEYYRNKLCDYFTLYGYKQNKLMYKPNNGLIKSRQLFNYIKTMDANIYGNNMDKTELEELKEIFNSGITFWHYEGCLAKGIGMYDYSWDNKEA